MQGLRTERNISQATLAKELGVARAAISFWENGVNEPKLSYLIAIAKYFGVTLDYLAGLED